jgi:hypothetical protein
MRSYARIASMILVFIAASMSHATGGVARFSGVFVLATGNSVTEVRKFQGIAGPATLMLSNGGDQCSKAQRVSSAWATVNGAVVFPPARVNRQVGYLQATVALKEGRNNVLKVHLKGKEGAKIRIKIVKPALTCGPS